MHDVRHKRGNEEDYFHKQDLELLERMRKARAAEQAHKDLGDRSGLRDPELLKDLESSGSRPTRSNCCPSSPSFTSRGRKGRSARKSGS